MLSPQNKSINHTKNVGWVKTQFKGMQPVLKIAFSTLPFYFTVTKSTRHDIDQRTQSPKNLLLQKTRVE